MSNLDRYFDALDLKPGASIEEIKQAYRDLAQIWHPDRYSHNPRLRAKAEERFKLINEGYQKLLSEAHSFQRPTSERGGHPPKSEPTPKPPKAAAKTHPRVKREWLWTLLSIVSFVVIRSCYKALESPSNSSYSPQTRDSERWDAFTQKPLNSNDLRANAPVPAAVESKPNQSAGDAVPKTEFENIELSSWRLDTPWERGVLRNDTKWTLTQITVVVGSARFNVELPGGQIGPSEVAPVNIYTGGDLIFLDERAVNSSMTIEAARGYRK